MHHGAEISETAREAAKSMRQAGPLRPSVDERVGRPVLRRPLRPFPAGCRLRMLEPAVAGAAACGGDLGAPAGASGGAGPAERGKDHLRHERHDRRSALPGVWCARLRRVRLRQSRPFPRHRPYRLYARHAPCFRRRPYRRDRQRDAAAARRRRAAAERRLLVLARPRDGRLRARGSPRSRGAPPVRPRGRSRLDPPQLRRRLRHARLGALPLRDRGFEPGWACR